MRVGAPVTAVAPTLPAAASGSDATAPRGISDSSAGSAMHAPTPRKNRRRLRLRWRWAAIWSGVSVGWGSLLSMALIRSYTSGHSVVDDFAEACAGGAGALASPLPPRGSRWTGPEPIPPIHT